MTATFNHYWTGVAGGPCPACGLYGDLLRLHGEFGPDGVRNISHYGDGMVRECQFPADVGWVKTRDGRWWFEPDEPAGHVYVSTACLHDLHEKCRQACKYCGDPCECRGCDHSTANTTCSPSYDELRDRVAELERLLEART